jgi:capsular polysaccharide biosynthesis protein
VLKQIPELEHAANGVEPVTSLSPVQATGDTLWYLVKRSWIVVLFAVIAAAAAGYVSKDRAKAYESTATVLVNQGSTAATLLDPSSTRASSDPERDVNTQVALITLPSVAAAVKRDTGVRDSVDDLLDDVSTEIRGTSDLVEIKARRSSAAEAQRIAQSFASQYVAVAASGRQEALNGAVARTRDKLEALTGKDGAKADRRELRRELRQLRTAQVLSTPTASIVDRAQLEPDAVSPKPVRDAVLVGIGAALLCIVALLSLRAIGQARRLSR